MPSKKQKKQITKAYYLKLIDKLIDEKKDIVEITTETRLPIYQVANYCAILKKIPGLGAVDFNKLVNGYADKQKQKAEEEKKEKLNKPFRDQLEWWN